MTMDLIKQVKKNTRLLMHHIGLGGDAHIPVNSANAGFMTPDQKDLLEKSSGNAFVVPNGTDWNTLPAGYYKITNAVNNPIAPNDFSITYYDIKVGEMGRKQIRAFVSSIGWEFYRTIHSGGALTSGTGGWRLARPRRMWGGSIKSGSATFSDNLDDNLILTGYTIWYTTDTGQSDSVSIITNTSGATSIFATNLPNDDSDGLQVYECKVSVTRTGFTIDSNFSCSVTATGPHYLSDKFISIIRIEAF